MSEATNHPSLTTALLRGWRRCCPRCGSGAMFRGYLSIADSCAKCTLPFEPLRADDAPAYFTIAIVGHVVVSGLLALESYAHPPTWVQLAIWLPLTLAMTLGLLPYIKGAVMAAIFCANREH
ncbi:uncharacterized protein (DUF983 family) [Dongia mobilis]|uniref:Uncharacterized protein (DUF983 family) n=1 Tax=Dongia mobilis TaxID=578943 RepID=A0A4R6WWP3_9PROT|nr:DUF983 domain-containing protein [Dongia mobilis]TDQ84464.1 uncharacterized protein (DUF983 family) [Dongia mobilis]